VKGKVKIGFITDHFFIEPHKGPGYTIMRKYDGPSLPLDSIGELKELHSLVERMLNESNDTKK